jgi:hypothetical protein
MQFLGANPEPHVIGLEELPGKSNYFIGNDPENWRTEVSNYARIEYQEIYPGIDLYFYGNSALGEKLEYDFIVAPGADPKDITLSFEGIDGLEINAQGDLVLHTPGGEVIQHAPISYQELDCINDTIPGRYVLLENDWVSFQMDPYDPNKSLIIDPLVLSYSTYIGGNGFDPGSGITIDDSGNVYVVGGTNSSDFPTVNPFQPNLGGSNDCVVFKLNTDGSSLLYSTYLGGSKFEGGGFDIVVDDSGNAYVTGHTNSINFPTANPFQPFYRGMSDVFVTKLNADGSSLVYSTYLGGSSIDIGSCIAIDSSRNAYVTGYTFSDNFPTVNPFQPDHNSGFFSDVFVTRFTSSGTALIYSTYLGGSRDDEGWGIAVDDSGNAYVSGSTKSFNFPTANPFQPAFSGSEDAFVTRLNSSGSALVYSTYLGGNGFDRSSDIVLNSFGNVLVTGWTNSNNFPTMNPFQPVSGGAQDVFVSQLNASGSALIFSTYLGGSGSESTLSIAVDDSGNAFVTGGTYSSNFPTVHPFQPALSVNQDAFVTQLNASGSALVYSTYLGGSNDDDYGSDIAVDDSGNAFVTGWTNSDDFPTENPFQPDFAGSNDAFVTKLILIDISCSTFDGLDQTISDAEIDNEGVRNSLQAKANNARKQYNRGKLKTSGNVLCAILHETDAQDGKHITPESAQDIRDCVKSLAENLGIPLPCEEKKRIASPLIGTFPNPFRKSTVIEYRVDTIEDSKNSQPIESGNSQHVTLHIYDLMGREVKTLVEGIQQIGTYTVDWDGKNFRGEEVPSGVYFYRLQSGDLTATKKMILLR